MCVLRGEQAGAWGRGGGGTCANSGREEKPSRIAGFLAINGQFPLGLFPEEQIVLKIDAGLGCITDTALPGAVHTSLPPGRS